MSQKIIRSALESRLNTWAAAQSPAIPVAWQNVPFTPPSNARYLKAFLLPAETQDPAVTCDIRTFIGVFQVSIVIPDGAGSAAAETLLDSLVTLFAAGTPIVKSGVSVVITRTPSSAPAIAEPGVYVVPVSIRYRADVTV